MKAVIICALVTFALCLSMVNVTKGEGTVIAVDPPSYGTTQDQIGRTFTLNINITSVTNLWAWYVRLNWNPETLNATLVQEGPFLKSAGSTLFLPPTRGTGYLEDIGCPLLTSSTANGSGILFNVTFEVLAVGQSDITLNETRFRRFDNTAIPVTVNNGQVIVTIPEFSNLLVFVIIFAGATMTILVKERPKAYATR